MAVFVVGGAMEVRCARILVMARWKEHNRGFFQRATVSIRAHRASIAPPTTKTAIEIRLFFLVHGGVIAVRLCALDHRRRRYLAGPFCGGDGASEACRSRNTDPHAVMFLRAARRDDHGNGASESRG